MPALRETDAAREKWLACALIMVLTLGAYGRVSSCGFIWDDDFYVTANPTLVGFKGLAQIWTTPGATPQYYPLVFTTFWVEYQLWGLDPAGFHAVNLVLHLGVALLWWRVLARLGLPAVAAWLAAALFALHPVHVESVAWITERKNVLSGVFYLCAALAYLRFDPGLGTAAAQELSRRGGPGAGGPSPCPLPEGEGAESGRWKWYVLALGCFVAALLSKTVACTFPAVVLLVTWWKRGRIGVKDVLRMAPFFVVGVALGLVTAWVERHIVGAAGQTWHLTAVERVLVAGRALWFYAWKLVWPVDLMFSYPRWMVSERVAWQYLFPLGALGVMGWLAWRGRGGEQTPGRKRLGARGALVGVLFFAGTLFPALGFINVFPMQYSFVADHFNYMASMGLLALLAVGMVEAYGELRRRQRIGLWAGVAGVTVLLVTLAVRTSLATGSYFDARTLWVDTLERNPHSWLAHNNLGVIQQREGDAGGATASFRAALEANPDYPEALANLAALLLEKEQTAEAVPLLERALQGRPNFYEAHANLGMALLQLGEERRALVELRAAQAIVPGHPQVLTQLAMLLAASPDEEVRQVTEARKLAEDAVARTQGWDARAWDALAVALAGEGKFPEAVLAAQKAQALARADLALLPEIVKHLRMFERGQVYRRSPRASGA